MTKSGLQLTLLKYGQENLILTYLRIGTSTDFILRYEAYGIASGTYSSMKNIVLIARLKVRRGSHC